MDKKSMIVETLVCADKSPTLERDDGVPLEFFCVHEYIKERLALPSVLARWRAPPLGRHGTEWLGWRGDFHTEGSMAFAIGLERPPARRTLLYVVRAGAHAPAMFAPYELNGPPDRLFARFRSPSNGAPPIPPDAPPGYPTGWFLRRGFFVPPPRSLRAQQQKEERLRDGYGRQGKTEQLPHVDPQLRGRQSDGDDQLRDEE
jgi:hypothetical protein